MAAGDETIVAETEPQAVSPTSPTAIDPIIVKHKAWEHLMEYPTLADAHKMVSDIRWVKPIKVSLADSFDVVSGVQPIKYAVDSCDKLVDSGLCMLDERIPSLKTAELCDITDPIVQPFRSAHFLFVKGVVEPTAKHVNDTRILVHLALSENRVTDAAKKITSPIVETCNLVVSSSAHYVLPGIDVEPAEELRGLSKTKVLLTNILTLKKKEEVEEVNNSEVVDGTANNS